MHMSSCTCFVMASVRTSKNYIIENHPHLTRQMRKKQAQLLGFSMLFWMAQIVAWFANRAPLRLPQQKRNDRGWKEAASAHLLCML